MTENDEQLQTNTYVWSQSSDQVTISFLVPESVKAKDLDINIERQYLTAGLKGHEPVFQVIYMIQFFFCRITNSYVTGKTISTHQSFRVAVAARKK